MIQLGLCKVASIATRHYSLITEYQEIYPFSAMNIDNVKINTSLIMTREGFIWTIRDNMITRKLGASRWAVCDIQCEYTEEITFNAVTVTRKSYLMQQCNVWFNHICTFVLMFLMCSDVINIYDFICSAEKFAYQQERSSGRQG